MTVKVPEKGPRLVREFYQLVNMERAEMQQISAKAGVSPGTLARWRRNKRVYLDTFEAALGAMDYELVILPKAKPFTED